MEKLNNSTAWQYSNEAGKFRRKYIFELSQIMKFICFAALLCCQRVEATPYTHDRESVNIILFIGDGMSLAQWQTGMIMSDDSLHIERMSTVGIVQTNPLTDFNGDAPSHGTAIATGVCTRKGAVGIDAEGKPLKTLMDYAKENRIATGIVSANSLMEGSLAPFIAPVENRMQLEDIAKAYVDEEVDVFIGGGIQYFTNRKDGKDFIPELSRKGYQITRSKEELQHVNGNKLAGFIGASAECNTSQGSGVSLPFYVQTAINLLSRNDRGFLLLIDDVHIDRASHAKNTKQIGAETIYFDKAIGVALEFAKKEKNTLVIAVGGPEASGMVLVGGNIQNQVVEAEWVKTGMIHTGTMVPIFSDGFGAERFQGIMKNTDLFFRLKEVMLSPNTKNF